MARPALKNRCSPCALPMQISRGVGKRTKGSVLGPPDINRADDDHRLPPQRARRGGRGPGTGSRGRGAGSRRRRGARARRRDPAHPLALRPPADGPILTTGPARAQASAARCPTT